MQWLFGCRWMIIVSRGMVHGLSLNLVAGRSVNVEEVRRKPRGTRRNLLGMIRTSVGAPYAHDAP